MRALAMRFRGILRGGDVERLDVWLRDADRSTLYGIRRFAYTLRLDLAAARNAITEAWSKWPDRRSDQPAEDTEAFDVWPRRNRFAPRQNDPHQTRPESRRLRKPPKIEEKPFA